jgi:hypothetical protein
VCAHELSSVSPLVQNRFPCPYSQELNSELLTKGLQYLSVYYSLLDILPIEDFSKPHSPRPPRGLVQEIVSETLRPDSLSYRQHVS